MKLLFSALQNELYKAYKSKVVWLTAAFFTIAPIMAGFFMFVLKDPSFAKTSGLLGDKAMIIGEANWPAYMMLYAQMISVGGLIIYGFITSWIFGREYVDGTIIHLFVLPYSRGKIVVAKFVAAFLINSMITLYILALGLIIGYFLHLPNMSFDIFTIFLPFNILIMGLTIGLSFPVAFLASYGKGYLAPIGFIFIILVFSQLIGAAGYGEWFPWSIPTMYSGMVQNSIFLSLQGIVIVLFTTGCGLLATFLWWNFADHH